MQVPRHIQRLESKSTFGWQVRYNGTHFFSDSKFGGPTKSLAAAQLELNRRIRSSPAPTRLQLAPSANKTSDLPVGISGPIVRRRAGSKLFEANLSVSLPRFGQTPRRSTIYIGTEATYTVERFLAALQRANEMRSAAEAQYRRDATAAKRKSARAAPV